MEELDRGVRRIIGVGEPGKRTGWESRLERAAKEREIMCLI